MYASGFDNGPVGVRGDREPVRNADAGRRELTVELAEGGVLAADERHVADTEVPEPPDVRAGGGSGHHPVAGADQAAFTGMVVPLASGALGSVMVTTPSLNAAVTLPVSTAAGSRIERTNAP